MFEQSSERRSSPAYRVWQIAMQIMNYASELHAGFELSINWNYAYLKAVYIPTDSPTTDYLLLLRLLTIIHMNK